MPQTFTKDPDAVKDYEVDWTQWLGGVSPEDTITTSAWAKVDAADAIVIDSDSNTTKFTTVFVSGGVVGEIYEIRNRITTVGLRTEDATIKIIMREK